MDGDGHVYVVDTDNHRVQEFTSTGTFVSTWGTEGFDSGQFYAPLGVASDGVDRVYVADTGNDRIQVFGPTPRPDGRIKLGAFGDLKGDNVYNTTGVGQTRRASAARGATVTYWVSAQNDAPFADALRLRGTASNAAFKVTYTTLGEDITADMTAGTYTTPELGPGDSVLIKVVVKVRTTARRCQPDRHRGGEVRQRPHLPGHRPVHHQPGLTAPPARLVAPPRRAVTRTDR